MIQGPEIQDDGALIEDDDAQLELQLALERYSQFIHEPILCLCLSTGKIGIRTYDYIAKFV